MSPRHTLRTETILRRIDASDMLRKDPIPQSLLLETLFVAMRATCIPYVPVS